MIVQSCTSIRQLSVEKPLLYLNKFLLLFCKRYPRPSLCRNVSSVRNERCNISHIKVFPQMGNIITAAITVE